MTNRIVTGEKPDIVIEIVDGDVSVRGWPHPEVVIAVDPRKIELTQGENSVHLRLHDDTAIQLPAGSRLRVERVTGDIAVNGVTGSLFLGNIGGDAAVRRSGPLTIEKVEGDLDVRGVQGDCTIGQVRRDASVNRVTGVLKIDNIGDDLAINDPQSSVYATAGDDAALRVDPRPGCSYEVRTGKDLTCRLPALSSASVTLTAGESIKTRNLATPPIKGNSATFQIGNGEAVINLTAGKRLELRGSEQWVNEDISFEFGPEMSAHLAELAQQMEAQVSAVALQIEEKINSMGGSEEVATRIQERILAAARRAEEKITEVMRNAELRANEAQRRAAEAEQRQRSRGRSWGPPIPPVPPVPPLAPRAGQSPVSEDERMLVLRMVSEGKISVEQAEKLLAALNAGPGAGG